MIALASQMCIRRATSCRLGTYELMQSAYKTVGLDFEAKEEFIGSEYHPLLRLGSVSRRFFFAGGCLG